MRERKKTRADHYTTIAPKPTNQLEKFYDSLSSHLIVVIKKFENHNLRKQNRNRKSYGQELA